MDSNFKILYAIFVIILSVTISDIAIIAIKNVDYFCIIHNISKSEAVNLLKNSVFKDRGYFYKILSAQDSFFKIFFCIYKMVDSEYSMGIFKSVKISIGTVMKKPELLKFVPDYLETKKMCKYTAEKLPYLLRFVSD